MFQCVKKDVLFFLLWFVFWPEHACAIELLEILSEIKVAKELAMTQDVADKKKYNLLAMMIGCQLNDECMLSMLKIVIKSDPNPVYSAFLLKLEAQADQIQYDAMHCNTKENHRVKQAMTQCLSSQFKKNNTQNEITMDSIQEGVNACIQSNMEKLANEGNLFAQAALVRYFMKRDRFEEGRNWSEVIQHQAGTPVFEDYQRCVQSLN